MSEYPPSRKGVISELMRLNYQSRDIGDMADGLIALFANAPERDLAKAWDEGHLTSWKRGPSGCKCGAWSDGECACGLYGTGEVLSLAANPYRTRA